MIEYHQLICVECKRPTVHTLEAGVLACIHHKEKV